MVWVYSTYMSNIYDALDKDKNLHFIDTDDQSFMMEYLNIKCTTLLSGTTTNDAMENSDSCK